jgi:hypothetical protein
MIFSRRKSRGAVAERRPEIEHARELEAEGRLYEAIDELADVNRRGRDTELEIEIRRLRNVAGVELLENPPENPVYPEPADWVPPRGEQSRVPEVSPDEVTPEVLRAAILDSGCLLVRGLMDPDRAERLARDIDHSFAVRERVERGETDAEGYYDELEAVGPYPIAGRGWIKKGGGVLAADSPRMLFDMLEAFESAGLRSVIEGYLGEKPAISAQKCTLRKATPDVSGAWHQDGKFMGPVRSVNVWLSLSRCGDVAPSMDIVPRRLEEFVEVGGEGTILQDQIGEKEAAAAAEGVGIVRPIFNPGDALIFDHYFLHQTGSDPSMPNPRYAIESWFFGPSAYPESYTPIAF